MNVLMSGIGDGKTTYSIIRSITKRAPIVCINSDKRKELIRVGKAICEKLYPGNKISMPDPVTYEELEESSNPSYQYIFEDLDEYFNYKGIKVETICVSKDAIQ